jgi:hypothetical protein
MEASQTKPAAPVRIEFGLKKKPVVASKPQSSATIKLQSTLSTNSNTEVSAQPQTPIPQATIEQFLGISAVAPPPIPVKARKTPFIATTATPPAAKPACTESLLTKRTSSPVEHKEPPTKRTKSDQPTPQQSKTQQESSPDPTEEETPNGNSQQNEEKCKDFSSSI